MGNSVIKLKENITVVFCARFFYPHIGGVEKHVLEVGKKLVARGDRVIVITEELPDLNEKKSSVEGVEIIRLPVGKENWFKKFRIWRGMWRCKAVFEQADVVHCHDVFFWYLPFRFIFPYKKVFTTFHGYESYPIKKKAIIIRKISEKLSWGNICIGDFMKKWYETKPDFVSYGAVELANSKWRMANSRRLSALFIGRLDEQTGISTYNKAFEIIRKKYPEFEFMVVGDGPYRNKLNKMVKSVGFKENPEEYFQRYNFAFCSRYLSILEAMAARRLVFAVYDNPVKEDYLRMSTFAKYIIIENAPERLAEKVIYYLNHPEEEALKVKAAYGFVKNKTWDAMVGLYISLWNKSSK